MGNEGIPSSIHETPFDSLPNKRKVWPGQPGSREEGLGRLVILTPEIVANAAKSCIRSGHRVSLNWDLTRLEMANFNRSPTQHHIIPLFGGIAYDDVYIFNPQQSSQWDGLRHFSAPFPTEENPTQRFFYGGVTASDISNRSNTRIGIHHWAKEGICGRGVLLDYVEYAKRHSIVYKAMSDHAIPLETLLDVAREQGSTFRRGDILLVRVGLTKQWDEEMTTEEKVAYAAMSTPQHAGVEGTEEMLRWIWDEGFAAVASDAVSFEVYPAKERYTRGEGKEDVPGLLLHEFLIAGWGMPVGEMFDLEALSERCRQEGRWDFFLTSAPLNMPGGVSSPPNCLALF